MVNQNPQLTLSTDKTKVMGLNVIKIAFVAIGLIGVLIYINYMGLIEDLTPVFEMFGAEELDTSGIQRNFIIGIVLVSIVATLLVYVSYGGVRYIFYNDFMVKHQKTNEKQILYDNIVRVSFNKKGVLNKLFNMGTINFDLVDETKDKLEYIDSPEDAYAQIQNMINNHKMQKYSQFEQKQKVGNILDKF
jgi:hypothetical protein